MKGCLSLIIKIGIAVLVFFGLKYIGAVDFIQEKLEKHEAASEVKNIEKAKDIIDLSGIDEEYSVDKNFRFMKNRIILIQHKASGQKIAVFEPRKQDMLTKEDITSGNIREKTDNLLKENKHKLLQFDKVEVIKQGSFQGLGQTLPYVKIEAEASNLPVKSLEGIISAADTEEGRNIIIIAFNEKNKYSQIITEALFKKIKARQMPE